MTHVLIMPLPRALIVKRCAGYLNWELGDYGTVRVLYIVSHPSTYRKPMEMNSTIATRLQFSDMVLKHLCIHT